MLPLPLLSYSQIHCAGGWEDRAVPGPEPPPDVQRPLYCDPRQHEEGEPGVSQTLTCTRGGPCTLVLLPPSGPQRHGWAPDSGGQTPSLVLGSPLAQSLPSCPSWDSGCLSSCTPDRELPECPSELRLRGWRYFALCPLCVLCVRFSLQMKSSRFPTRMI
jgi:hypothetical protein